MDSDQANELFNKILTSALDTHAAEIKIIKISPKNMLRQHWMSPALLKSLKSEYRLYRKSMGKSTERNAYQQPV